MAKKSRVEGGAMPRDNNNRSIPVGQDIITKDLPGNLTSPISLLTIAIQMIIPPKGAVLCVVRSAGDLRLSALAAMTHYTFVPANEPLSIPCAARSNIYVRNDVTGTNNLYFHFEMML